MANASPAAPALPRVLGPLDATCVVIGAIVGVGIFFTPRTVAELAGAPGLALWAWALGGFIALCGALTFAELGAQFPNAGGQYEILRESFGRLVAFAFVVCNATAVQTGAIAIIALLCAQHLLIAVGRTAPPPEVVNTLAFLLIALVTLANVWGVRWGSGIQNVTVAAKLATLAAIALLAVAHGPLAATAPNATAAAVAAVPPAGAGLALVLFAAVVPSFFAFGGWQHALWIAGEIRAPRRNLPLAVIGGVAIVVAAYLLVNWAFLRLLGYDGVIRSGALAADAVGRVWPAAGERCAAAAVGVSALGVLNAQLLSGPRLIYRLAQDGRFLSLFARVSPRRNTPLAAILLLGGLGTALLAGAALFSRDALQAIDRLTTGVVFVDGIFFALTGLALFVLRRRGGAEGFGARFGYPAVAALFVIGELGILSGAATRSGQGGAVLVGLAWVAGAVLLYLVIGRAAPARAGA
jgi:APA family basic amino acid/polyamine antiporter